MDKQRPLAMKALQPAEAQQLSAAPVAKQR
jgi:hypothetical protein